MRDRTGSSPWALFRVGARLRSPEIVDLLSRRATRDTLDWRALRDLLLADQTVRAANWRPVSLMLAPLLACVLEPTEEHFDAAEAALSLVVGRIDFEKEQYWGLLVLCLQIAAVAGNAELLERLAPYREYAEEQFWASETDVLRLRALAGGAEALRLWWASLNSVFTDVGNEPFELGDDFTPDRLFASLRIPELHAEFEGGVDAPLVSVIVPSYRPDSGYLATVTSLANQSWRNLEILLIDDCSPDGLEHFEAAERLDQRVRVIRMPENGGAYRARNEGLRQARGEFVAFLDADDVAHPRRIETQLRPLREDPALIATTTRSLRLLNDGRLTYFGYAPTRMNMSSLFFRREEVLDRLGRFDLVRKDADSEFETRLLAAFGEEAILRQDEVMSLVQLTAGSLSRSDFRYGWSAEDRSFYKLQYRDLHERLREEDAPDWRYSDEARPTSSRALPHTMIGERAPERLDYAVLADWERSYATAEDWASVIPRLRREGSGTSVGLLNGYHPRLSGSNRPRTTRSAVRLVEDGSACWVAWRDDTEVDTLIVTDPEYFTFLPDPGEVRIRARRVIVVAEASARGISRQGSLAPSPWIDERIELLFGVRPTWITASPPLAFALGELGSEVRVGSLRSLHDPSGRRRTSLARGPLSRRRIGVPWYLERDHIQWDPERLRAALPKPELLETRIFDETGCLAITLEEQAAEARPGEEEGLPGELVSGAHETRAAFLNSVDVLLLDPFECRPLFAGSWIAAALEQSVPVVAPRSYADEFGELVSTFTPGGSADAAMLLALDDVLGAERLVAATNYAARIPSFEVAVAPDEWLAINAS